MHHNFKSWLPPWSENYTTFFWDHSSSFEEQVIKRLQVFISVWVMYVTWIIFWPTENEEGQPNSAHFALGWRQPYLHSANRRAKNYSKVVTFNILLEMTFSTFFKIIKVSTFIYATIFLESVRHSVNYSYVGFLSPNLNNP